MNNVKPSTIMLIAGGAVLFISTFLDWISDGSFSVNGWETDFFGFHGIFVAVIGLVIGVSVALTQFTEVSMPDKIVGMGHDQLHLALGFAAFLITFGYILVDDVAIGLHLGWISAAVIVAASIMDILADSGEATAPTQF